MEIDKHGDIRCTDSTVWSTETATCPYCGHRHNPSDDNYELYDEACTEWECHDCGKAFAVTVVVSHSWTTRVVDDD